MSGDDAELRLEVFGEFADAALPEAIDLGQGGFSVRRSGGEGACYWCGGELAPTSAWCCAEHLSYRNDYQARRLARALGKKDPALCHRPGCQNLHVEKRLACEGHLAEARERYYEKRGPMQEKLPKERAGITHKFEIYVKMPKQAHDEEDHFEWIDGYIQANCYPADYGGDAATPEQARLRGQLGEIFLTVGKQGAAEAMLGQWAMAFSLALQYGVPLEKLCRKFLGAQFAPAGATKNPDIPRCTSLVNYVVRWVLIKFGGAEVRKKMLALAHAEEIQP